MKRIRRDAVATLGMLCLTLLACGWDSADWEIDIPEDECASDPSPPPQAFPSACATLPGLPEAVFGTDDGWLLAWVEWGSLGSVGGDTRGGAMVKTIMISPDTSPGTSTAVSIGERLFISFSVPIGATASSVALVGDTLVAAVGPDLVAIDARGAGPSFRDLAHDVPAAVELVAIDSTRVAAFGTDLQEFGEPAHPTMRVYDVTSGEIVTSRVYDPRVAPWWFPPARWLMGTAAPAIAVVRTDTDRWLMAWVAENARAIQAMEVDSNGEPLGEPTTLTRATTDLYTPRLARISETELGMVWTGDSGLEVRYRSLPDDLAGVEPTSGIIVNATRRCSQEDAVIASAPGGGALVVWRTETGGPLRGRWVGTGQPATLDPPESDLSPSATCSVDSGVATLASGPHGLVLAWPESGFDGKARTIVTTVSR